MCIDRELLEACGGKMCCVLVAHRQHERNWSVGSGGSSSTQQRHKFQGSTNCKQCARAAADGLHASKNWEFVHKTPYKCPENGILMHFWRCGEGVREAQWMVLGEMEEYENAANH